MSKRKLIAKALDSLFIQIDALKFFYYKRKERKRFPDYEYAYKDAFKGQTAYILANGPSLTREVDDLLKKEVNIDHSLVVNFFVHADLFIEVKPMYYCLADPLFFTESKITERVINTFKALNEKVSWPMTLFIWKSGEELVSKYITNRNIKLVGLTILLYGGNEKNRYLCYKNGTAVPSYVNVTIMAIYALLNIGYDTIMLYGVDHSFLAGLCINDDNCLCIEDRHFYGVEKVVLPPRPNGDLWKMKDFVYDKYLTFLEHERMQGYAEFLGAKIINCTRDSWIDAYPRIAQIEKQNENKESK